MIKNLKNETELSGLYFVYKGSTNLEKKGTYGLSHYGEHLKCKAFDDLQDELQSNGITWNAYTADNEIVFYFTGLEEYLAPFREILISKMYTPFEEFITVEDVEKEKEIVLEEYQDYYSKQNDAFYLNLFRKKFNYYSPIGLKEDIVNFNYESVKEFFSIQYNKPDTIISISKSFILDKDLEFENREYTMIENFIENLNAPLEKIGEFPETSCLFFHREIEYNDIPVVKIINHMLGDGLNSPLYQEIREKKALCYYVGSTLELMGKLPIIGITILTSPDKLEVSSSTLKSVLDDKEKHMSKERLETVRKAIIISVKKKLINRHASISDILDPSTEKVYSIIETISLEDIMKVYDKYFVYTSFVKSDDKNY